MDSALAKKTAPDDLDLIAKLGTATREGVVLRRRDVDQVRTVVRRLLADLDRLEGSGVIVSDDAMVPLDPPTFENRKGMKRMLGSKPMRAQRPPALHLRSWQPCDAR